MALLFDVNKVADNIRVESRPTCRSTGQEKNIGTVHCTGGAGESVRAIGCRVQKI